MSETDKPKPKYVGYGYHGGGRSKTANPKVFVNTTISGSPEEIALLKEQAKNAGKTVSRYVLDLVLPKEKKAEKVNTILHVTAVEPKEKYHLLVTFDTGEKKLFDFTHLLDRPMYKPLKNKSFFDTVKIENGVTVWNDKIDIAPEYLYENGVPYIDDNEAQNIDDWDYYNKMKERLTPAKVLKIRRENAGLTQTELSEKCNIAEADVTLMESGKKDIDIMSAKKLAEALNCDAEDFVKKRTSDGSSDK